MKRLYVGNHSFGVTEEELQAEFENAGIKTGSVTVVRDRDSGQPRGFGLVEISQDGDLEKDITALNGKNLSGRAIVVNEARPKATAVAVVAALVAAAGVEVAAVVAIGSFLCSF